MQKRSNQTTRMLLQSEEDIFNHILGDNHAFKKLEQIIDFQALSEPLRECYSELGQSGVDVHKGIKALLIQFWEDYSDRQMEKCLKENIAVRWFCEFGLSEETPDHTYFSRLRKRLGTKRIADFFEAVNGQLHNHGLFGDFFTFIDASTIITKTQLWEERDKAIADGHEKLNNSVVKNYATDKDARWGAKSKTNIWFGYKRTTAVDMRHGLIKKVAVTSAEVLDHKVAKSVAPKQGMVFQDKGYDTKKTDQDITAKGAYSATIRKNNNPKKNHDLDAWRTKVRMPFEGTFSKLNKRARYRDKAKVTMQVFLQSTVYNLKKAVKILSSKATVPIYAT
jgi:transposase, IS5 family